MRRVMAMLLSMTIVTTTGCASAAAPRVATGPAPESVDATAMGDYLRQLPAGSRVRVERVDGRVMHGTLMKATGSAIVVQKSTRVPETPVDVPVNQIARVTVDGRGGNSVAKSIAIGIASGAGVFFALLAIAFAGD